MLRAQMFYKKAWVEYHPLGVVRCLKPSASALCLCSARRRSEQCAVYAAQVGAIVPWNYPFHNVFNPLTAALFAGNGIVIKARSCSPGPWHKPPHAGRTA